MRKRLLSTIFVFMILIWAVGCSGIGEVPPKEYTYEDLSEEQKKVVDGVYDMYSVWKTVYDSGEHFPCTNVNFFYEDRVLIFTTYYTGRSSNDNFGFVQIFEVDTENGELSGHEYSLFDDNDRIERQAAEVQAMLGTAFSVDADEVSQKDILANTYIGAGSK